MINWSQKYRRTLNNVVLKISLRTNDRDFLIRESDVQEMFRKHVRKQLANTKYQCDRERFDRTDCVITEKGEKPLYKYEIKSYFREEEKFSRNKEVQDVITDLIKLKKSVEQEESPKGYFVIFGFKNRFRDIPTNLDFIKRLVNNDRHWLTVEFRDQKIRLRPSRRVVNRGDVHAYSWEILAI